MRWWQLYSKRKAAVILALGIRGWNLQLLGWLETNEGNKICGYKTSPLKESPRFGDRGVGGLGNSYTKYIE